MKQTAVEKMIQYFIEQKNNGASYWCINDLLGQLQQAKAMEKEQIVDAFSEGTRMIDVNDEMSAMLNGFIYYTETYEQIKQG